MFSKDGFHQSILLFFVALTKCHFFQISPELQNSCELNASQKYTNAIKVTYNAHAYVNVLVVKMTVQTNNLRKSSSTPLLTTTYLHSYLKKNNIFLMTFPLFFPYMISFKILKPVHLDFKIV